MKFKYIQLFVISFIVGMVCMYISPTEYKTIIVYPTLTNLKKIQYKDSANNCFQFTAKLVDCTKKAKVISVQ
jgi:hypothetical protein